MQAFLPEQRRSMRMDFRINAGKENDAPRLRASIPLRRVGAANGTGQTAAFAVHRRERGLCLGSEHTLRANTFRAADMPWAVDKPSENVGRRAYLARRQARADGRSLVGGHTLRGTRFARRPLCGFPARRTTAASRNRPEIRAARRFFKRRG